MEHGKILKKRFEDVSLMERNFVWSVLCKFFFKKYIKKSDSVIDIGAGFCEFINNIECKTKIAIDISKNTRNYAQKNVKVIICSADKIPTSLKTNVIFMSNFLEHLENKESVIEIFKKSHSLLKPGGRIIIVQPNIDLAKEKYWDRIDHTVPLNGKSVIEGLEVSDFRVELFIKKFLPLTTQSKLPKPAWLIKLYLSLPSYLRFFAGQSLFIAKKEK
jgi:SAM-dependent methyltransferase